MAWTRVDDDFIGHPKTVRAGKRLGRLGLGRVLAIWLQGQAHANRYLTDGFLSREVVEDFTNDPDPIAVAQAMVEARLWDAAEGGFQIHDYLAYNPSREAVLLKREKDLQRKRGGGSKPDHDDPPAPDSEPIPESFRSDSARNREGGSGARPGPIPQTFRADSTATRAGGSARPVPRSHHGTVHHDTERNGTVVAPHLAPLASRGRIDIAWPGRPPVPGRLHADFVEKLGGDQAEASRRLEAWYPVAAAAWADKPIGDDDFTFWRARFREWIGTTVTAQSTRTSGNTAAAAEALRMLGRSS